MQRRWLELLKEYDIGILYHPGKDNVVEDALRRKSMSSLAHIEAYQRTLAREVHQLASLGVHLVNSSEGGVIIQNRAESSLVAEVKEKKYNDPLLVQVKEGIHNHKTTTFSLGMDDGTLHYQGRLYVLDIDGLQERIMAEAHTSSYSMHPSFTKMYHDLKEVYWVNDMKRNVVDFVARCPNCLPHEGYHVVWEKGEIESEKVIGDSSLIMPVQTIEVNEELLYEEIPVAILDSQV
ncbi:uncharacterized protein [Nicotiana sylvestris]|uniref:uncharacterized protein n=1 Tax=Nicotiana sylvestris TaxID=4096 RepID=UPI00388C41F9